MQAYQQYLEAWIAAYCANGSKRSKQIAAKKVTALTETASAHVWQLKREEDRP